MKEIKPTYVTFEQAKFFSNKGLEIDCTSFYVKPNCKLFSVDEKGRHYSIKNTPKKLYKIGEHFVLKDKNIFLAPEQHQVIEWLRINHGIWISVSQVQQQDTFTWEIVQSNKEKWYSIDWCGDNFNSPQEAYSAAFDYIKNNDLI